MLVALGIYVDIQHITYMLIFDAIMAGICVYKWVAYSRDIAEIELEAEMNKCMVSLLEDQLAITERMYRNKFEVFKSSFNHKENCGCIVCAIVKE